MKIFRKNLLEKKSLAKIKGGSSEGNASTHWKTSFTTATPGGGRHIDYPDRRGDWWASGC